MKYVLLVWLPIAAFGVGAQTASKPPQPKVCLPGAACMSSDQLMQKIRDDRKNAFYTVSDGKGDGKKLH